MVWYFNIYLKLLNRLVKQVPVNTGNYWGDNSNIRTWV